MPGHHGHLILVVIVTSFDCGILISIAPAAHYCFPVPNDLVTLCPCLLHPRVYHCNPDDHPSTLYPYIVWCPVPPPISAVWRPVPQLALPVCSFPNQYFATAAQTSGLWLVSSCCCCSGTALQQPVSVSQNLLLLLPPPPPLPSRDSLGYMWQYLRCNRASATSETDSRWLACFIHNIMPWRQQQKVLR